MFGIVSSRLVPALTVRYGRRHSVNWRVEERKRFSLASIPRGEVPYCVWASPTTELA